jgi:hypothetical protein
VCTAAPRSLAPPVSVQCCRKNDRSIRSDIGRHRGAECSAERCRHSSVARKARCSCTRAHRTPRIHPCRPNHHRCRRGHWSQTRRQHRPSQSCRRDRQSRCCRTRRSFQTHRLRRPAEDTRRQDSRRSNKHRCRARNRDTRPDWARSRRRRHLRSVRPRLPRRRRCRPRVHHSRWFLPLRPRSIHRRHQNRASPSIHTLQPPAATLEEGCSTAYRAQRGSIMRAISAAGTDSPGPARPRQGDFGQACRRYLRKLMSARRTSGNFSGAFSARSTPHAASRVGRLLVPVLRAERDRAPRSV